MKLIGNIFVWIFISLGLIAATSFYAWPVGAGPATDARFEIGIDEEGRTQYAHLLETIAVEEVEVAAADAQLNPETLAALRAAGVERVIVKHPSGAYSLMIANWSGKWLFLISAIGLIAGAMILRAGARMAVAASEESGAVAATAEEIAGRIRAAIADLRAALPAIEGAHARETAIVAALGEVQADLVPAFVETRPILIGKRGMGGFAAVMDKFAGMERLINRAWSAAADGALHESVASLDAAAIAADELAAVLGIHNR